MYTSLKLSPFLLLPFLLHTAHAALYVINPRQGGTCTGGQPCTVQWLDDGTVPLLTAVGICQVGLYTGNEKLVQTITPVDVSETHSLMFTPDPKAGPDADTYYIAFTSTTLKITNSTDAYQEFSPPFRLTKMSGSFAHPVGSDTSAKKTPSSVIAGATSSNVVLSTSIVGGTLSTSALFSSTTQTTSSSVPTSTATSSGFSTATMISMSASSSAAGAASTSTSGALRSVEITSLVLFALVIGVMGGQL